jgi:hypothetical protein
MDRPSKLISYNQGSAGNPPAIKIENLKLNRP